VNPIVGFLNFMGKMGLTLRGDPPRKINVEGRVWGEEAGGVVLSIREIANSDPAQLPAISVVMKNVGSATRKLTIPGWMFFYQVETPQPLTAFGRQLLMPERRRERLEISLGPGDATETDVPVAQLYEMRARGEYQLRVSCTLEDGVVVRSNQIVIRR
jgi:hypothetical protein